jgi:hypothetical protein
MLLSAHFQKYSDGRQGATLTPGGAGAPACHESIAGTEAGATHRESSGASRAGSYEVDTLRLVLTCPEGPLWRYATAT